MANDVRIRTQVTGAKQATGEIKGLHDAFDRLQKQGAKGFGIGVGASVTTAALGMVGDAVGAVGDFMANARQRASDLNESMGKVNVVFGEGAKEVEAWADTAAEAFGQSKQQALEAAGTYGNLFQAFGVGADKSREMSMALVELAADLASFNNTSIEDALIALRSGLSGETEPLKRYGIAISDARMRTELATEGYKDLGATLTPLQKSMAAYALIMKDSSLAQGDFARTADGVANSIRANEAAMADLEAEIGQKSLPTQKAWLDLQRELFTVLARGFELDEARTRAAQDLREKGIEPNVRAIDALARQYRTADLEGQAFGGTIRSMDRDLDGAARAAMDWGDAADDANDPTRDLRSEVTRLREEAKKADDAIDDMSDTISDELFGDAINAGNIAQLEKTYRGLLKDREETKKGSRDYKILTGRIAENRQELFDLQLQMKEEEGPEAVIDWLRKQKRLYGDANGLLQRLIDKYRTLSRVQGSLLPLSLFGGKVSNLPTFAEGGRYTGGPMLVGEDGPEIVVPDGSGTVIPNDVAMGGGTPLGGAVQINVNVTGASLSPAITAQFTREVGPAIADYLKRRGLLAA